MASNKVLFRDKGAAAASAANAGLSAKPAPAPTPTEVTDPESITVTAAAAAEMKRQADKRGTPGVPIRVGLRGGGCSGYSYHFDWDDKGARPSDHVIEAHGVVVHVDPKSLQLLKGTVLDFVSSMMSHGFKFHNPNAKGSCGCGESVSF